jgi:hypothetical protein
MYRNTTQIVFANFDLTGVKPCADFDAERPDRGDQLQ